MRIKFPSYLFGGWDKNDNIITISDYIENLNWNTVKANLYN